MKSQEAKLPSINSMSRNTTIQSSYESQIPPRHRSVSLPSINKAIFLTPSPSPVSGASPASRGKPGELYYQIPSPQVYYAQGNQTSFGGRQMPYSVPDKDRRLSVPNLSIPQTQIVAEDRLVLKYVAFGKRCVEEMKDSSDKNGHQLPPSPYSATDVVSSPGYRHTYSTASFMQRRSPKGILPSPGIETPLSSTSTSPRSAHRSTTGFPLSSPLSGSAQYRAPLAYLPPPSATETNNRLAVLTSGLPNASSFITAPLQYNPTSAYSSANEASYSSLPYHNTNVSLQMPWNSPSKEHRIPTPNPDGTIQCLECGKCLKNKACYRSHLKIHQPDLEKSYKCDQCDASFLRSHHLSRHKRIHSGEKPHVCTICDKRFNRSDALSRHKAKHNQQTEPRNQQDDGEELSPLDTFDDVEMKIEDNVDELNHAPTPVSASA